MKEYLQHLVTELKNFSKTLDKTSILVDKPWALIDSDFEMQKLIFKKDKQLIMSKDGQVTMGAWDYLPEAKSLLIDRGVDKILCNECFIDEGVMILKMDGLNTNFFIMANENIVPDLDVYNYLKQLRYVKLNIHTCKLADGKYLEFVHRNEIADHHIGDQVTIESQAVEDGSYKTIEPNFKFIIKNSIIIAFIHEVFFKTKDGLEIMIEQRNQYEYDKGDKVWLNGNKAPDGKYRIIERPNIEVKEGIIIKKSFF
ncbi:MAG: hypothetical protein ACOYO1_20060 [Bacteroidales bacterium]